MPYFGTGHLSEPTPTLGAGVGLWDAIHQGAQQRYLVDSPYALAGEAQHRWTDSLRTYERVTGEKTDLPTDLGSFDAYVHAVAGRESSWMDWFAGNAPNPDQVQQTLSRFKQVNDRIKEMGRPDIQPFEQVLYDVVEAQRQTERTTEEQAETSGWTGAIGHFLGAMGGSFTSHDPLNILMLPFGGFGKTAAMKVATEAGIMGALGGLDTAMTNPNRRLAGLPEENPLYAVLAGAAGGAIFRGGFEAAGKAFHLRSLDEHITTPSNERLHEAFASQPDNPSARAGEHLLSMAEDLDRANPYGEGAEGQRRFVAELSQIADAISGQPEPAVARFLPEIPFEYIEKNFDFEMVKEQTPALHEQMVQAQQSVVELEHRIEEAETGLAGLKVSDAVARIDQPSGELVRSFEQDLVEPGLTRERRADITRKVEQIVETLGPEKVAQELQHAEIKPRKVLQSLRQSREAAVRRYKTAYRAVETEAARLNNLEQIKKLAAGKQTINLLSRVDPEHAILTMRHDEAEARAATIEQAVEAQPERAGALVAQEPTESGTVDVGLEAPVADLVFTDANGNEVSFSQVLNDLKGDAALEEAMRTCLL